MLQIFIELQLQLFQLLQHFIDLHLQYLQQIAAYMQGSWHRIAVLQLPKLLPFVPIDPSGVDDLDDFSDNWRISLYGYELSAKSYELRAIATSNPDGTAAIAATKPTFFPCEIGFNGVVVAEMALLWQSRILIFRMILILIISLIAAAWSILYG
ncbi:MAG: hypothetical protein JNM70_05730 [Anaerolineae bacterium]|nr:hypothetical protein [Anaerolineae bacterium]